MPLEVHQSCTQPKTPSPSQPGWARWVSRAQGHTGMGAHVLAGEVCSISTGADGDKGTGGGQWPDRTLGAPLAGPAVPFVLPGQEAPTLPLLPRQKDPKGREGDAVAPGKPHLPGSRCARQLELPALAGWCRRIWPAFRTVTKWLQMRMWKQCWAAVSSGNAAWGSFLEGCTVLTARGPQPGVCHRRCTSLDQRAACNTGAAAQRPTSTPGTM